MNGVWRTLILFLQACGECGLQTDRSDVRYKLLNIVVQGQRLTKQDLPSFPPYIYIH